jgi:hypothetical protein
MSIKIGINAPKFASKNDLNFFVGTKVAALRKALRDVYDARQLLAQYSTADLNAVGFTSTPDDEVGYLLGSLKCGSSLYQLSKNTTPEVAAPHDYDLEMRYAAATDN